MEQTLELQVLAKESVAEGVVQLSIGTTDGTRLPDWAPGAHIDLVLPEGTTRQYSLCGDRWDPSRYTVAVLREPRGRGGSAYVHDQLQVGDVVGVGGPRNNFRLVPASHYVFIAGGIGITPLRPMIDQAVRLGSDWRLLYGGRQRSSMAFGDELAKHGERVTVVPQDEFGRLPLEEWVSPLDDRARVYCCGPVPLLEAVEALAAEWSPRVLRTERFSAPDQADTALSVPFEVQLARSGRLVTVPPTMSVLAAVNEAGAGVLSSCHQGVCGTCETDVLEGIPDHRDSVLTDSDRDAGHCMMVCVSRSRTERLVLDL
ncbi:MAG: 2Fe-2S iron-sulfur cluster binding domain-containing protein [Actinobacteria bacterium]|uniref:Unannotated protein n=1 Tax=freshwater metagenome TaxID=449393 RepID=A0A6J7KQG9_9ZZZZ|nr:2Fe-2S iron-sulfur cluster binding domain-containing protein [Actinomycetota bacterium]